jgi:hypothetical protein
MRRRLLSHLTYANVMVTLLAFVVLGGGTALASYVITSNSQVGPLTISGHAPPSGDHANVIPESINGKDLATGAITNGKLGASSVNSSKVLDGSLSGTDIATGAIRAPQLGNVPAVHADRTTNQTIPSGTPKYLALDQEEFDTASMHASNASANCTDANVAPTVPNDCRVTAPIAGIYQIDASINWSSPSGARTLDVLKNRLYPLGSDFAGDLADSTESVSTLAQLSAGDYVELLASQTSVGDDPNTVNVSPPTPELSLYWVGPG